MNRIVASLLITFIFSMHSAWAIGVHTDSNHMIDSSSYIETHNDHASDTNIVADKNCEEYGCHLSVHATGLFSALNLSIVNQQQSLDSCIKHPTYCHLSTTPQRPPKA